MSSDTLPPNMVKGVQAQGFALVSRFAAADVVSSLIASVEADQSLVKTTSRQGSQYAARNLLQNERVAAFSRSQHVLRLLRLLMPAEPFPVRAILFDKVAGANWRVGWHQDLIIPVRERIDTPGFTSWSLKAGAPHVKPPAEVLEQMLTLRVALDDCGPNNGPLMVLPGSHRQGVLQPAMVRRMSSESEAVSCTATAGDALVMRPLLLHASARAGAPSHRRVLHVEFACDPLPGALRWPCQCPLTPSSP